MSTKPKQQQVAAALGLSKGRVSQLKRAGAPVEQGVAAVRAWRAARHKSPQGSEVESILRQYTLRANLRYRLAKANREEFFQQQLEGKLVSRDAVLREFVELTAAWSVTIQRWPDRLIALVPEALREKVGRELRLLVDQLLAELAQVEPAAPKQRTKSSKSSATRSGRREE